MSSTNLSSRKNRSSTSLKRTPLSPFLSTRHSFPGPPKVVSQEDTAFHKFGKFSSQDEGKPDFNFIQHEENYWSEGTDGSDTEDNGDEFGEDEGGLLFEVKIPTTKKLEIIDSAVANNNNKAAVGYFASPTSSTSTNSSYFNNSTGSTDSNGESDDTSPPYPSRPIPSRESSHLLETLFPIPSLNGTPVQTDNTNSSDISITTTTAARLKENLSSLFLNTLFFTPPQTPSSATEDHQILFSPAFTPSGAPSHGPMSRTLTGSKEISLSACGSAEKIRRKTSGDQKKVVGLGLGMPEVNATETIDEENGWVSWGMRRVFSFGAAMTREFPTDASNRRGSAA